MSGDRKTLVVDWRDFEVAFGEASEEMRGYVDLNTGRSFTVDSETLRRVEETCYENQDDDALKEALAALSEEIPPEVIEEARSVVLCDAGIVRLEPYQDEFRDLVDFVASVKDPTVRRDLERTIEGRGAFRRFRDALRNCFRERRQWFDFREAKMRERATTWFRLRGIDVQWALPKPVPPMGPPPREALLAAALKFASRAAELPGVKRIALIGSLTRDEPEPKDVDMLVTVADDLDLEPLATAARKLSGRAQQLGRGADVFLANERNEYIGRTCPWRECAPGVRASCDADHCGRRHYLHDDLRSVRLDSAQVKAPQVVLWPALQCQISVPADVQACLIKPFLSRSANPSPIAETE
jgi:predicted nucleotidyltransferase